MLFFTLNYTKYRHTNAAELHNLDFLSEWCSVTIGHGQLVSDFFMFTIGAFEDLGETVVVLEWNVLSQLLELTE